MIRTPLCDLLGIEHPIVQGGMAWVGTAELSAAVSEAGGFGIIGGGNAPPDWVRAQIQGTKARTSKPFGVNIPLFSPFVDDIVSICIEEGVKAVATGAGNPAAIIPRLKEAGILVMPVVASVALAKRLERMGADIIVAEGMESGGHIGEVTTMPLVPQVVDAVSVPVVAAGGFADGLRQLLRLSVNAHAFQSGSTHTGMDLDRPPRRSAHGTGTEESVRCLFLLLFLYGGSGTRAIVSSGRRSF